MLVFESILAPTIVNFVVVHTSNFLVLGFTFWFSFLKSRLTPKPQNLEPWVIWEYFLW